MKLRVTEGEEAGRPWTLTEAWSEPLANVVDMMWCFEGEGPPQVEHHLPNGLVEIVVTSRGVASVAGLQTAPRSIRPADATSRVLGLRLSPLGAYRVLRTPLHQTTNAVLSLEPLVGPDAIELVEICATTKSAAACLAGARSWVCKRIAAGPPMHEAIAFLAAAITQRDGDVSIRQLETAIGMSPRRVLELCKAQLGVTPKLYARLIRFRRALVLLHEARASVADVSVHAGYYDQPHLHVDFVHFAGITPGSYVKTRRHTATTFATP